MKMKLKILKLSDLVVVGAVAAIALLLIALSSSAEALTLEIISDKETVYELPLREVRETFIYRMSNGMEIEISRDCVKVISSDCPSKNCIGTGALTSAGDICICIPNKTVIRLKGDKKASTDAITY